MSSDQAAAGPSGPARAACPAPVPRVIYITGWCRSGSTLVGNLLGELPATVHVGELSYLWANGVAGVGTNNCCGCGTELARCEVWRQVLRLLGCPFGDPAGRALARAMMNGHAAFLRTRHTRMRLAESSGRRARPPRLASVLAATADCYAAIGAVTGANVVVDSSKFPAEAAALAGLTGLDLRVLHLVRDPRATAYSWQRSKGYIPPMGAARSSGYWTAFNAASELVGTLCPGRYLRVGFEEFAARPRAVMTQIMRWAQLGGQTPVDPGGTAVLGVNHTVTGNPDRLRSGPVRIRADEQWRRSLPAGAGAAATLLTWPLLPRYGYRMAGWRRPR